MFKVINKKKPVEEPLKPEETTGEPLKPEEPAKKSMFSSIFGKSKEPKEPKDNNNSILYNGLKGIGLWKGLKLSSGKEVELTQKEVNAVIRNLSHNNIIQIGENINFNDEVIEKLKELASKVKLDPDNIKKFETVSNKLGIKDTDFNSIVDNLNREVKDTDKIDINEMKSFINSLGNIDINNALKMKDVENTQQTKEPLEKFIDTVETPKIQNEEYAKKLNIIRRTVKKIENGKELTKQEKERYEETLKELQEIDDNDKDKDEIEKYLETITTNFNIEKNASITKKDKVVVDFKQIASVFRTALIIMITICIVVYIIVVIISIINVINLLYKILNMIISLFYNSVITNNQTLSYNARQIVKSTKNNTKYDLFNIILEQETAITVFNSSIYIIYILMAYVITFILCIIYTQIYRYTHILNGQLSDIDVKYEILTIIAIIFIFSIIHLLIYKFLFKNIALTNFRSICDFESNVDKNINNIILPNENNTNECNKFYQLLSDTSKRNEIDAIISDKMTDIDTNANDIRKYLMMYNIYMYFEEYLYMNDVMKDKIANYFGIINDDNGIQEPITFIGLLDSNERKLLKAYHENLPFHSLVSAANMEKYQKINEDITQTITNINKQIIKYTGTFFPFLITCLYIILICIYNIYTFYIILKYVIVTEKDNLFITFIYNFSHNYISYCEKIYSIIFNK